MPAEFGTSADAVLAPVLLTVPDVTAQGTTAAASRPSDAGMLSRGWSVCAHGMRVVLQPHIPWHSWQVQLGILAVCLILVSGASLVLATFQELLPATPDLAVTREYPDSGKVRVAKGKPGKPSHTAKTAAPRQAKVMILAEGTTGSMRTAMSTDDDLSPAEVNSASYQAPTQRRDGAWLEGIIESE